MRAISPLPQGPGIIDDGLESVENNLKYIDIVVHRNGKHTWVPWLTE